MAPAGDVLACGHYAAAIPEPDELRWLRFPSQWGAVGMFHEDTAAGLLELGHIVVDGVKGRVRPQETACNHELVVDWEGTWLTPHP